MFPLYAPVRLGFYRQDQSWYVAIMCVALTVAWLANQLIGLDCVHVLLEGFLFGLSHAQSEDQFECVSCAND